MKSPALVTHYNDDSNAENKCIQTEFGKSGNYEIYLLGATHDGEPVKTTDDLTFDLPVNTCILITEI